MIYSVLKPLIVDKVINNRYQHKVRDKFETF